jgi:hypothetical protein
MKWPFRRAGLIVAAVGIVLVLRQGHAFAAGDDPFQGLGSVKSTYERRHGFISRRLRGTKSPVLTDAPPAGR